MHKAAEHECIDLKYEISDLSRTVKSKMRKAPLGECRYEVRDASSVP